MLKKCSYLKSGASVGVWLVALTASLTIASGCSSSSSSPAGDSNVIVPGPSDGTDDPEGTDPPIDPDLDPGNVNIDISQAILNGSDVSDAERTVWDCGNQGVLSFWSDGNGSRVLQSNDQAFIWEIQVAGTITANGEFSAALFNINFTDIDTFSASEASDSTLYSCARTDLTQDNQPAALLPGYEVIRGETTGADGVYTVSASCSSGKKVLGGGGSQGSFGWYVDDSRPDSDGSGWQVQYAPDSNGGNGSGIGEAWAVCASVDESTILTGYEVIRGETMSSGGTYTVEAACPSGKHVLGGGASQGAAGWYMDDSRPGNDGLGWQVQYSPDKDGGNGTGIGEAWAICATIADPDSALSYEVIRGETISANGGVYTVSANCTDGKSVLGGGGSQGSFGWYVDDTVPNGDSTGWQVQYAPDIDGTPGNGIGEAWSICAFTE